MFYWSANKTFFFLYFFISCVLFSTFYFLLFIFYFLFYTFYFLLFIFVFCFLFCFYQIWLDSPISCFSWITSLKSSPELIEIGCNDCWYLMLFILDIKLLVFELLLVIFLFMLFMFKVFPFSFDWLIFNGDVIDVWVCNPVIQSTWSVIQETKSFKRRITFSETANTSCCSKKTKEIN